MNLNVNPVASASGVRSLFGGWKGTKPTSPHAVRGVQRIFMRSCLESTLIGRQPEGSMGGADGKKHSTDLHELKRALLHEVLEQTCDSHVQKMLCGAANAAAELAWETNCPFLLFPCLFEEKAAEVLDRAFKASEPDFQEPWAAESGKVHCTNTEVDPGFPLFHPVPADEQECFGYSVTEFAL